METNSLGILIKALNDQLANRADSADDNSARLIEEFNKQNEMRFRFEGGLQMLQSINDQEKLVFNSILNTSWSLVTTEIANNNDNDDESTTQIGEHVKSRVRLISACLNLIRIVSRDSETIPMFENAKLLETIQVIANLSCQEDKPL